MFGFVPILYNLLQLAYNGGAAAGGAVNEGTDPVAAVQGAWDQWIKAQTQSIREWFKAQAYGAMDLSLIVMGVCLFCIALIIAANKDIASVGEVVQTVRKAQ